MHLYDEIAHEAEVRTDQLQEGFIYHGKYLFRSVSNGEKDEHAYVETKLRLPLCPSTLIYEILTLSH